MKIKLALIGIFAIIVIITGCAWLIPDATPLVIYRRHGGTGLFTSIWQLTVDINGKVTVVANPGSPLIQSTPNIQVISKESMAELQATLNSEEMQSIRPEQLLQQSKKIKTPEYTYTLLYNGRTLQTVSGAVPPGIMPALRLLDQQLQMMNSQATAPGVDQFNAVPEPTATLLRPTPSPSPTVKPTVRPIATMTPRR